MHLVPAANTYVQVDVISLASSCFLFPVDSFAGSSVFIYFIFLTPLLEYEKLL